MKLFLVKEESARYRTEIKCWESIKQRAPHPIPYQGSKRNLARIILSFFPAKVKTLLEPFSGSAAVTLAAAAAGKCSNFYLNDINEPLMSLWHDIIRAPEIISENYARLWKSQKGNKKHFYDFVRDEFNKTKRTDCFLYLLARCVKASIRYNSNGEFNQSPDNRRKGREPQKMAADIFLSSKLLAGRTVLTSVDYRKVLKLATKKDLIYMDPPYQGTCLNKDPRYYSSVDFNDFVETLDELKNREISFILSYDGKTGDKIHGKILPSSLGLYRIEIDAGRSSQATLLGRNDKTYESLYISSALVERLGASPEKLLIPKRSQLALFA